MRTGEALRVPYAGHEGIVDCYLEPGIAVEIESRTPNQIRGALTNLVRHKAPLKLVVLIPAHHVANTTAAMCRDILGTQLNPASFRVVSLKGTGSRPFLQEDTSLVAEQIRQLLAAR